MSEDGKKEDETAGGDEETPAHGGEAQGRGEADAEPEAGAEEVVIRPYEGKIGESRDNLRQREGWFRRRSGGRG